MADVVNKRIRRVGWIDIARGICMLAIIAGHFGVNWIGNIVFLFHLPVFFILSGYLFKDVPLTAGYIAKKFKTFMLPYFITCFAIIIIDAIVLIIHGDDSIASITGKIADDFTRSIWASGSCTKFGDIDLGGRIGAIWFLPALFFATIFFSIIKRLIKNIYIQGGVIVSLALVAYITASQIWLPFSIQSAMFALPFMYAGYEVRHNPKILAGINKFALFIISLIVCIFGFFYLEGSFYMASAYTKDILFGFICAFAASYAVIYISKKIGNFAPLEWIGKNSLIFMCVHLIQLETQMWVFDKTINVIGLPNNGYSRILLSYISIPIIVWAVLCIKKMLLKYRSIGKSEHKLVVSGKKRDASIDVLRAFLIISMIVGHFAPIDADFRMYIYSFHMPAFIFISGFFFKDNCNVSPGVSILKSVKSLLIPYVICAAFKIIFMGYDVVDYLLVWVNFEDPTFKVIGMEYFFVLLFVIRALFLLISTVFKNELYRAITVLTISVVGFGISSTSVELPWLIDIAMFALVFYYIGFIFKKYNIIKLFNDNKASYFVLAFIWLYMIIKGSFELVTREYNIYGLGVIGAIAGTIIMYYIASYVAKNHSVSAVNILKLIGRYTLYILIVHDLFGDYIHNYIYHSLNTDTIYYMIFHTLVQLACGVILGLIFDKCILKPFKNKKHKAARIQLSYGE